MNQPLIVGAGIYGMAIAAELRRQGHDPIVFDRGEHLAGSRASGNLMKPSWFSGLGKDIYEPALETLRACWDVQEIDFNVRVVGTKVMRAKSFYIPLLAMREQTTLYPHHVLEVGDGWLRTEHRRWEGPVIVCAGFWTSALLQAWGPRVPLVQGKAGVSFTFKGQVKDPFIRPWAPYKQLVAYNQDAMSAWVGDGSAILHKNWNQARARKSLDRCADAVGLNPGLLHAQEGIRPYVKNAPKHGYVDRLAAGLMVATGGAKNGLLAAGWAAHRIGRWLS